MGAVRVEMNSAGVRAVLNSSGVQSDLLARANRVASSAQSAAGAKASYHVDVQAGRNRAHALVTTGSGAAMRDPNALVKALGAARG